MRLLLSLFLICLTVQAASITGRLTDLIQAPVTSNTFVRFELKNCGANIPRVVSQAVVVPSSKDIVPNAQGYLSGQIVGNDMITCDVLGSTYYHVSVWNGRTRLHQGDFRIVGSTWDITLSQPFSLDPTAFPAVTGYKKGDILVASAVNRLTALQGNKQPARKFLQMSGDGTEPDQWDWVPLTADDIPSGIPASKITGLPDLNGNVNYTLPGLQGDLSSSAGSTSVAVTGIRGRAIGTAVPADGEVLQYNGTSGNWEPKSFVPVAPVSSFNTRVGAIVPEANDYSFAQISGTVGLGQLPDSIPATKINGGSVTDAQFGYLSGVTSSIQTQLNAKAASSHTHNFSTLQGSVAEAQLPTGIDAAKIANGSVDNTRFQYLSGVTSDIQAQINALGAGTITLGGDVTGAANAAVVEKIRGVTVAATAPTTGQVLSYDGAQWAASAPSVPAGQVTGLDTAVDTRVSAQKAQVNGLATLDAGGKIPSSQLPAIAITDVYVVASQVAQLALTSQPGDVAVRSDLNKSYIHNGGAAGTMADWTEIITPGTGVISVNGSTGAVSLTTTDIAEGTNLYYSNAKVSAAPIGGDVTGTVGASTVSRIRGVNVTTASPVINNVLVFDGSSWAPGTPGIGGDVSGTLAASTVAKIQGRDVSSSAPGVNQVLKWNGSTWIPADDAGGAGADATSIRGVNVSGTAPTTNQVLQYNGTTWIPAALPSTLATGGDLSGSSDNATVIKLRNRTVASTAPTDNQALVWNGTSSQWEPKAVSGNATSLQTRPISATVPTNGQVLSFDGTNWTPAAVSGNATTIQGTAVSATTPVSSQLLAYNGSQWAPKDDFRQVGYVVSDPSTDLTTTTGTVADVVANRSGGSWTITEVYCKSDQATASTFNLSVGGSNVFASAQNCTSTGNSITTFSVSTVSNGQLVSHSLLSAATGNKQVSVTIRYRQN